MATGAEKTNTMLTDAVLQQRITDLFTDLALPSHGKGVQNLRTAIAVAVEDDYLLGAVTKELYPEVAKRNRTTTYGVERSIRQLIRRSFDLDEGIRRDPAAVLTVSRSGCGRPTNRQLITIASAAVREGYRANPLQS